MSTNGAAGGLSKEERDAVKERAKELRAEAKAGRTREAGEIAVREAVAKLEPEEQAIAEGLGAIVGEVAPELMPKTYYGMPGYANADGKIVVFMQPATKFKVRYSTIGFEDRARLDDGDVWPVVFAVRNWTPEVKDRITELVRRAVA